jgi:hypothetical protein
MDCTISHAKSRLLDQLRELGPKLDAARDPAAMRRLIRERKSLERALLMLREVELPQVNLT